jgi:hypothetical protein
MATDTKKAKKPAKTKVAEVCGRGPRYGLSLDWMDR